MFGLVGNYCLHLSENYWSRIDSLEKVWDFAVRGEVGLLRAFGDSWETFCFAARMNGGRASIYILTFDIPCTNSSSSSDCTLLWLLWNIPCALWSSSLLPIRATKLTKVTLAWWFDLLVHEPTLSISRLHLIWVIVLSSSLSYDQHPFLSLRLRPTELPMFVSTINYSGGVQTQALWK